MAAERVQRRLAAILVADVVGYSRLIESDEEGTRARLRSLQAEVIDPQITADGGRIVKTMGDGILAEFPSAVDAVRNALDVFGAINQRNADVPETERVEFRVGINVGDVIVEGNDIHGDGVNVAARLQALCEPGEIYVSGTVYDQTAGKLAATFEDLGEKTVKNIAKPVRVYRTAKQSAKFVTAPIGRKIADFPDRPSIAVLPLINNSGDHEQDYFADGMAEDLITDLSKISGLFVASRNASFALRDQMPTPADVGAQLGVTYVLEGSVRKMGERLRINMQLVEAKNGGHIWAERYDGEMSKIFDFQDSIRDEIITVLKLKLTSQDHDVMRRLRTTSVEAYDLYLKGRSYYFQYSPDALAKAFECLKKAIELDPDLAEAYSYLSACEVHRHIQGWREGESNLEKALAAAQKAVALDPSSAIAHTRLGWVRTWRAEFEAAEASFQTAIAIDPQLAETWHYYTALKIRTGEHESALALREKTLEFDPFDPLSDYSLGTVRFFQGRLEEAVRALESDRKRTPRHIGVRLMLAAAYAEAGRADEARSEIAAVRAQWPSYTIQVAEKINRYARDDLARLLDGLRKAGLPEK